MPQQHFDMAINETCILLKDGNDFNTTIHYIASKYRLEHRKIIEEVRKRRQKSIGIKKIHYSLPDYLLN